MRKQTIAAATAIMLATAVYAGAASAGGGGGGGGAEPMPLTNFTDMPSYHPNPAGAPDGSSAWANTLGGTEHPLYYD